MAQRPRTVRHREALHREAVAFIDSDCGEQVTIDRVARSISSSRRQLQRAFSEVGGTTFRAHLTATRMDVAARLLARTTASVHDIAAHVGYREPSQFTKAFKRRFGMTPTVLRVRMRHSTEAPHGASRAPEVGRARFVTNVAATASADLRIERTIA